MDLTKKHCVPCEGGDPPLPEDKEDELKVQVPDWSLLRDGEEHRLRRQFKFKTFMDAIDFVNKVARIADSEDHHPDIYVFYNKVRLDLFTHAVGGLSENDFIIASKVDKLAKQFQGS